MKRTTTAIPIASRTRYFLLLSILVITATLWCGVASIRLTGDDYQYLASLAPIHESKDIFRPFVTPDASPSYFRPLANMTMSLDFLVFGWNGGGYHLTNLFLHLVATALVFFFVRTVFSLSDTEALGASLAFGIVASHEMNLVWAAGRADILSAIFVMLAILLVKKTMEKDSIIMTLCALGSFMLALLSKESSVLVLPFIGILYCEARNKHRVRIAAARLFPFGALAFLFYLYHQHYATAVGASQLLTSEGFRSIFVSFRNVIYSLGYFAVPLDLLSATVILSRYKVAAVCVGAIFAICVFLLIVRILRDFDVHRRGEILQSITMPILFTLLTGMVLAFSFERWRLYLPSVGGITILAFLIRNTASKFGRMTCLIVLMPLCGFHIYRSLCAQRDWQASTALVERLKNTMSQILLNIPARPLKIGFLDVPAKLGSASVLQLGSEALLERAEADRRSDWNRKTGLSAGTKVDSWVAIDVYALDPSEAFRLLKVERIGPERYRISAPKNSDIMLYPATITSNIIARRDRAMRIGDSIVTPEFVDIVREAESGMAKSIEVQVRDSTAILLSLNGAGEFVRAR